MNLAVQGLILNLIGILILFYYGMPFRVPTGGEVGIRVEQIDEHERHLDIEYQSNGYIGLVCAVAGVLMQVIASWT